MRRYEWEVQATKGRMTRINCDVVTLYYDTYSEDEEKQKSEIDEAFSKDAVNLYYGRKMISKRLYKIYS